MKESKIKKELKKKEYLSAVGDRGRIVLVAIYRDATFDLV
jgi:hypothetical protein